ncbi:Flp pilus assembly complex ATPase component TadA [Tessaracoccus sp. OS52]|uniref:CpaF family protein n=1 Tax=Tessaracoccus sp. OS52 TaxID=2886691 RepID=UPI001D10158F|nr:ATPase, T2SS/T4P/T4SS family [Tessaracoccus sp. OS52]MCC2594135.1 Flp pilus assembly complex ATPase component TadA [Tessaracoccus sp. OS52]
MTLADRLAAARRAMPDADPTAFAPPDPATRTSPMPGFDEPAPAPAPWDTNTLPTAPPPLSAASAADLGPERQGPGSLAARSAVPAPKLDALAKLKEHATKTLYDKLGARLNDAELTETQLHSLVEDELGKVLESDATALTGAERRRLTSEVMADVVGLGPLESLLGDPVVTEIMVNGPDSVYVEASGRITLSNVRFRDEAHLRAIIDRIVGRIGRRIDESSPMVDARLQDGSRVNAIIPPLALTGSTLTIRKFAKQALTVNDLIGLATLSPEMAELLDACVRARLNIIVSGGTGTGKTTLLNVLSGFIPEGDRILTIEDAAELQMQQSHVVRLESRPPNIEGRGAITIRDLVRNALRMRPDRIVVGEVRGAEALDMLQAMNTGHDGSLSTIHANSARDALSRLETLVLMAGMDLPLRAIREQVASAVNLIVQIARLHDGTRRVVTLTEVHGMEGQTITTQDIFTFDYAAGMDEFGRYLGRPMPTGVRPAFTDRFAELGIQVSPRIFGATETQYR